MKRLLLILLLFSSVSLRANQILTNQFVTELVNFKPIDYRFPSIDNRGVLFYGSIAQEIIDTLNTDPAGKLTKKEELYVVHIVALCANIWDNSYAIYPFAGTTAFKHKYNWKDLRNSDAAFRLSFLGGGWVHSKTGAKPNGTTSYAITHFNANLLNSASEGLFIAINRHELTAGIGMEDLFTASASNNINNIRLVSSVLFFGSAFYFNNGTVYNENINIENIKYTSINRVGATKTLMGDNTISTGNIISNDLNLVNFPIHLGCRAFPADRQFYSNNEYNFFVISKGVSVLKQEIIRNNIKSIQNLRL